MQGTIKVLIIEENIIEEKYYKNFFDKKEMYLVHYAQSFKKAVMAIESFEYDVIVSGINYIDGTVFSILDKVFNKAPLIIITGNGYEEIAVQAIKKGAINYIIKDIELDYINNLSNYINEAVKDFKNKRMARVMSDFININNKSVLALNFAGKIIYKNSFCEENNEIDELFIYNKIKSEIETNNFNENDIIEIYMDNNNISYIYYLFYHKDCFLLIEK